MYRGLLSRMLVAALLIAVIAKPCLGLLVDTVHASDISIAVSDDNAVSENSESACTDICLSARVEENDAFVLPASTFASDGDDWAGLKAQLVISLPYLSHQVTTDFSSQLVAPNVRERLAVLSRFLL
ncbi:hypothetical protein [Anderseniella sp. Alg231-50]|uniref:hypothetical protein n=1 Tax=Anderseniella sp. Alg231-50 TaxID=1922226 RepID=UPI00307CA60F